MTDFFTWWLDHKDRYFNIQLKSETNKNGHLIEFFKKGYLREFFKIVECVELPDKDVWLGCKCCWIENNDIEISEETVYFRLSDINLVDYTTLFLKELTD